MTGKSKFIVMLITVFSLFVFLQIILYRSHTVVTRSRSSLINQYYRLKQTEPDAARQILDLLIKRSPKDQEALRELGYWYISQGNIKSAITQLELAHQNDKKDLLTLFQLAKLYIDTDQPDKAIDLLSSVKLSPNNSSFPQFNDLLIEAKNLKWQEEPPPHTPIYYPFQYANVDEILDELNPYKITTQAPTFPTINQNKTQLAGGKNIQSKHFANAAVKIISDRDRLMNQFYDLKRKNSPQAWDKINEVIATYPTDIQALKEAGYYALIKLNNDRLALPYFLRVYDLTQDPIVALQLGYIYDKLNEKRTAYYYFDLATYTCDQKNRLTAELAKTNLRGVQTKFLPYPYYASLDFSPLYMSRFKLLIYPIIFRVGATLNEKYNWKVYLSYRRTSDDQSSTSNVISNIYEDDVAITALGSQISPLFFMPQLVVFAEIGKSKDLVYRNRARFRSDFRGGMAYYNEWGRSAEYTFKPTFMLRPNADLYGDAIYYNRYHDGIATLRFRPGVRVFRYGSMSLDLYYRGFLVEDQARQFYNNIFENGPGLAVRFSDRYNVVLRYEQIHGRYLPASSPSPNPYSKNYHNAITELDTYFEF